MKIYINMDEGWRWWMDPRNEEDTRQNRPYNKPVNEMEIDEKTYREYQAIMKQAYVVQEALEHMYRHQCGLHPWQESPYKDLYDNSKDSNSGSTDDQ